MRLEPFEIYILECFREQRAEQLPLSEIVGNSTVNRRAALEEALRDLEFRRRMLRQVGQSAWYQLTEVGKRSLGMISASAALPLLSDFAYEKMERRSRIDRESERLGVRRPRHRH